MATYYHVLARTPPRGPTDASSLFQGKAQQPNEPCFTIPIEIAGPSSAIRVARDLAAYYAPLINLAVGVSVFYDDAAWRSTQLVKARAEFIETTPSPSTMADGNQAAVLNLRVDARFFPGVDLRNLDGARLRAWSLYNVIIGDTNGGALIDVGA